MAGFCRSCGSPISSAFCGKCGTRADAPSAPAQQTAPAAQPVASPTATPAAAGPTVKKSGAGKVILIVGGVLVALCVFAIGGISCWADEIALDPLHGYCSGAGQCIDNGTNTPTTHNPPTDFGFTISPGPNTGDLLDRKSVV